MSQSSATPSTLERKFPSLADFIQTYLCYENNTALSVVWRLSRSWSGPAALTEPDLSAIAEEMLQLSEDLNFRESELASLFSGNAAPEHAWIAESCARAVVRFIAYHMLYLSSSYSPMASSSDALASVVDQEVVYLSAPDFLAAVTACLSQSGEGAGPLVQSLLRAEARGFLTKQPLMCDDQPVWSSISAGPFAAACAEYALTVYLYGPLLLSQAFVCSEGLLLSARDSHLERIVEAAHYARFVHGPVKARDDVGAFYARALDELQRRYEAQGKVQAATRLRESRVIRFPNPPFPPRIRDALDYAQRLAAEPKGWPATRDGEERMVEQLIFPIVAEAPVLKKLARRIGRERRRS